MRHLIDSKNGCEHKAVAGGFVVNLQQLVVSGIASLSWVGLGLLTPLEGEDREQGPQPLRDVGP